MAKKLLLFLLFPLALLGQGNQAPVPPTLGPDGHPKPFATISFCTNPANATPCTNYAQVYSDVALTQPINQSTNPLTTDALGNAPSFYAAPGLYQWTVSGRGIATPQGPYLITVPCVPGNACFGATRFSTLGTALSSSDFSVGTGWGTGASIGGITGNDSMFEFTVTAGTSPVVDPTVTLTFHDGPWSVINGIQAKFVGGTGGVADILPSNTLSAVTLTYMGLPVSGSTYTISVLVGGQSGVVFSQTFVNAVLESPTGPQTITGPNALNLQGPVAFTANNTHTGIETFSNIDSTGYVTGSPYACTDVGINAALAAYNIVDFSACSTVSLASSVPVAAHQTLRGSLNSKIQVTSAALNAFTLVPSAQIKNIWFDCGNQPSYSGSVFSMTTPVSNSVADQTGIENVLITCNAVTTGNGLLLSSSTNGAGIAFLNVSHWRQMGLANGALLTASNNGWVNGNHFTDVEWSYSVYGWHLTPNGGQINGNICDPCSYQNGTPTITGIMQDGTTTANDSVANNFFYGSIWDATTPITISNSKSTANSFQGRWDGTPSDTTAANFYMGASLSPGGNYGLYLPTFLAFGVASGDFIEAIGTGTGGKSVHTQNAGGNLLMGIDNSTGSAFGHSAYASNWYSPSNDTWFTTPHSYFTGSTALNEITAPPGVSGFDVCYGDSTAHAVKCSFNNGAFSQLTRFVDMGQIFNAAGTQQTTPHVVEDSGTLTTGSPSTATITLTGSAIFTSGTSYNCSVTNKTTQANPLKISYTSGSVFVVTGPNTVTDAFSFICIGN